MRFHFFFDPGGVDFGGAAVVIVGSGNDYRDRAGSTSERIVVTCE